MPLEQFPALLLSIIAVGYTPGPANIFAMSCALRYGTKSAMIMWAGLLCGACCALMLTALAAHLLGTAFREYVPYVRYVAVAYILYLAWKTYRSGVTEGGGESPSFLSGMIVQMTNAKMILFYLSSYSVFVLPYSDRFTDLLPVSALLLIAGPGANLVWLLAGSAIRPFVSKYSGAVSVVMAMALVACALMVAFL